MSAIPNLELRREHKDYIKVVENKTGWIIGYLIRLCVPLRAVTFLEILKEVIQRCVDLYSHKQWRGLA